MSFFPKWLQRLQDRPQTVSLRDRNTADENELLDEAKARWENARERKVDHSGRDLHAKWREIDQFYRGQQWREAPIPNKSRPVIPLTFALVEALVPRLTDNDPRISVQPRRDPSNMALAKMLGHTQDHLWYVNRMRKRVQELVRITLKYGTGIIQTIWDPDFYDGVGEVRYVLVHPMNFYPDPRAYSIEQLDYAFTAVPKPLEYFSRRWPEKGQYAISDDEWTETEAVEGASGSSSEASATLRAYWFRDKEGRVCCMYYAGDLVLDVIGGDYDGTGEPVYRHNKFPFSRVLDVDADKNFWGIGEVEVVMLLNRLINSFEAQVIDNTRLMANSEWVVNKSISGLREEDAWIFNGRPGNVIFTHAGGVDRVQGMPVPAHIPQHIDRLALFMEQILGVHDATQGRRPVGVRSASAIIALQESSNYRIRPKALNLEEGLGEAADQANWLVLEYYDSPRQMRVGGNQIPVTLDIRKALVNRQFGMAQGADLEVVQGQNPQALTQDMGLAEQVFNEVRFPEFDVEVHIGPSVPYSQAMLYEQAVQFYQLGLIDQQAALEVTGFPNWEAVVGRMAGGQGIQTSGSERTGERV